MERVSKIFIPQGATTNSFSPATGIQSLGTLTYFLPQFTFPLQSGYSAIFKWANIHLEVPAGSAAAGSFIGAYMVLNNASNLFVQRYPAFPVSPSNIVIASAGSAVDFCFPVLPPPSWEWDDFAQVPQPPSQVAAFLNFNITATGPVTFAFSALLEVWKV